MGTIVQEYGPIYGEVVNGTVQGRPNGSVYVPLTNTIVLTVPAGTLVNVNLNNVVNLSQTIHVVAESQDLASNIYCALYSDSACTTKVGVGRSFSAGNFNLSLGNLGSAGSDTITTGQTYYLLAQLMNNGVAVAASTVIAVVGA